jgi:hypothetical protein
MVYIFTRNLNRSRLRNASAHADGRWEGGGGTRVLTVSGCRSQDPPCRGTRAPSRGIPSVWREPRELGGWEGCTATRATRTPIDDHPLASTHLFEIRRDCERLVSETEVGGDCDAVLAHHGRPHSPRCIPLSTVSPRYRQPTEAAWCIERCGMHHDG